MKFLFSILFVLGICCSQNSFAYTPCTLPAPENFQVLNQTPTYLLVGWDAVPGAIGYEIECKNANNIIVSVQSFSTPTSASFNIEPNTDYTITTRSIYSNNEVGSEVSSIVAPSLVLIVVDLLPGYQSDVTITSQPVFGLQTPQHGVTYPTSITPDRKYYYQFTSNGGLVKGIIHQPIRNRVAWGKVGASALPWNLKGITPDNGGFSKISHQMSSNISTTPNNAVYFNLAGDQLTVQVFHNTANTTSITNLLIYPVD